MIMCTFIIVYIYSTMLYFPTIMSILEVLVSNVAVFFLSFLIISFIGVVLKLNIWLSFFLFSAILIALLFISKIVEKISFDWNRVEFFLILGLFYIFLIYTLLENTITPEFNLSYPRLSHIHILLLFIGIGMLVIEAIIPGKEQLSMKNRVDKLKKLLLNMYNKFKTDPLICIVLGILCIILLLIINTLCYCVGVTVCYETYFCFYLTLFTRMVFIKLIISLFLLGFTKEKEWYGIIGMSPFLPLFMIPGSFLYYTYIFPLFTTLYASSIYKINSVYYSLREVLVGIELKKLFFTYVHSLGSFLEPLRNRPGQVGSFLLRLSNYYLDIKPYVSESKLLKPYKPVYIPKPIDIFLKKKTLWFSRSKKYSYFTNMRVANSWRIIPDPYKLSEFKAKLYIRKNNVYLITKVDNRFVNLICFKDNMLNKIYSIDLNLTTHPTTHPTTHLTRHPTNKLVDYPDWLFKPSREFLLSKSDPANNNFNLNPVVYSAQIDLRHNYLVPHESVVQENNNNPIFTVGYVGVFSYTNAIEINGMDEKLSEWVRDKINIHVANDGNVYDITMEINSWSLNIVPDMYLNELFIKAREELYEYLINTNTKANNIVNSLPLKRFNFIASENALSYESMNTDAGGEPLVTDPDDIRQLVYTFLRTKFLERNVTISLSDIENINILDKIHFEGIVVNEDGSYSGEEYESSTDQESEEELYSDDEVMESDDEVVEDNELMEELYSDDEVMTNNPPKSVTLIDIEKKTSKTYINTRALYREYHDHIKSGRVPTLVQQGNIYKGRFICIGGLVDSLTTEIGQSVTLNDDLLQEFIDFHSKKTKGDIVSIIDVYNKTLQTFESHNKLKKNYSDYFTTKGGLTHFLTTNRLVKNKFILKRGFILSLTTKIGQLVPLDDNQVNQYY